ncbi:hypothetical protein BC938DRAFT_471770 [Jimgerdemannia flammicorona]|uniref:GH18 domain-containing protein n=1 Tax=Jimgerdemannia flammicorona TaxID=994334 RepID=A0A433Q7F6_9FUNG|nr:hypothetical protein BC938DRAFT_471770 [Jimgerdemannia flammicorona]
MVMKSHLILLLLVGCMLSLVLDGAIAEKVLKPKPKPKHKLTTIMGNAAWMYPNSQEDIPILVKQVQKFNAGAGAEHKLKTIFVYGGALPFDGKKFVPDALLHASIQAFQKAKIPGLTIHVNLDANLNQDGSPILKMSNRKLDALVNKVAAYICKDPLIAGIHLDLEPFGEPFTKQLTHIFATMSSNLRNKHTGCRNRVHPKGRVMSVYVENASVAVFKALGPNGVLVWPGYDCTVKPTSVEAYSRAFRKNMMRKLLNVLKHVPNGRFMVAVPAAATQTEFAYTVVQGHSKSFRSSGKHQFAKKGASYITSAVQNVHKLARNHPGYNGMVLWKLAAYYTIGANDERLGPGGAFDVAGEEAWLQENL